ncbi:DctP family TRAP transporter solute-binding subunit [Paenibacillus sp. YYML68]|uniref:DctP family TRAP transporter solute-binding subunit n=1 Tax=Paenibacillus sp. YYML68 TaxID=2909250 RepID=UPI0024922270|nr:DctP family TRAP transporter solute-binding subunit [Paenibacillus sp. YYML68]
MRPWLGTMLFIIFGLTTAALVGFYPSFSSGPVAQDDEQQGFQEQYVIKFSHVVAESTPKGLAAQRFAELVLEKTAGRVKVEVYPNAILHTEATEKEALLRGEVQMLAPSFSNISQMFPEWAVLDLPFAFLSDEAVQEAFRGPVAGILFKKLEESNMKGLAFWGNSFKQMTTNRGPLIYPSDFTGQRFRILPSRAIQAQFEAFGATTQKIPFNQAYRAFESGAVDGGENTVSNIWSKKFYRVQGFMTVSNHGYLGYGVLMNKSYWEKLPKELQAAIEQAMEEATAWSNLNAAAVNERDLQRLRQESDMRIHVLTAGERAEWMRRWEPLYEQAETLYGRELVQAIRELQRNYGG